MCVCVSVCVCVGGGGGGGVVDLRPPSPCGRCDPGLTP